jgi:hypothetical protein
VGPRDEAVGLEGARDGDLIEAHEIVRKKSRALCFGGGAGVIPRGKGDRVGMSKDPQPHGALHHLTLFVAMGLMVGLLAVSGIVYSGSGALTFGPTGTLLLALGLLVSVATMVAGIAVILVKFR